MDVLPSPGWTTEVRGMIRLPFSAGRLQKAFADGASSRQESHEPSPRRSGATSRRNNLNLGLEQNEFTDDVDTISSSWPT